LHEECEKEIIMQKYLANFVVTTNVSSEIQADSIEEARKLIEDELRVFQIGNYYESDEASVISINSMEAQIDETFDEFDIEEIEKFALDYFND